MEATLRDRAVSMQRVKELDRIWARECSAYLQLLLSYSGPSPLFIQEESLDEERLAKKWRVELFELQAFVRVQRRVNDIVNGVCGPFLTEEDVVELGVAFEDFDELQDYLQEQADLVQEAHEVDEDDATAGWHSATAEDFGSDDDDWLQDAAMRGD